MGPPPHRVLIVGAGSIGERHLRCFLVTGRAQVSFVEVNPQLRATIAARYPAAAAAYASLSDALAHPWDIAVIATPAPLHVPQAMQLVGRGVHILIEKPLGITLDGVEALRALVANRGIVAGVAYVLRTQPALAQMRDTVASGQFGKPLQLVAVSGQNFPSYRPAYRRTYYAHRVTGGGAIQDALTHLLNAGQWLAGDVDRVVADAAHLAIEGVEVEDTVNVLARHGGLLASYSLNQHQAPNETTITLICERGTARFELHNGRWSSCQKPGEPWMHHGGAPLERDAPFVRQANAFMDAAEGRAAPLCTLDEGVSTLRATVAILASVDSARWASTQRIPP